MPAEKPYMSKGRISRQVPTGGRDTKIDVEHEVTTSTSVRESGLRGA